VWGRKGGVVVGCSATIYDNLIDLLYVRDQKNEYCITMGFSLEFFSVVAGSSISTLRCLPHKHQQPTSENHQWNSRAIQPHPQVHGVWFLKSRN